MKKNYPIATIILIAMNILVFIVSAITGDLLYNKGAFDSILFAQHREWHRMFTAMFLHADLMHLTGNMILLYLAGDLVERYCGMWRYFAFYILCGIMGNFFSGMIDMACHRMTSSVGASGAIFGLVGALLFLVIAARDSYREITLGRLLFMIVYLLYSGFTTESVNNEAHIGGLIAGIGIMAIMCRKLIIKKFLERERDTNEN